MGKVVLITGASSGIGEATARTLAAAGHQVFGGARNPEKVRPAAGVEIVRLDVRDEASVQAAVGKIYRKTDRIDVLINNAGVSLAGPIEASSVAEAQALFDTNLFGVLRVTQAVLPVMRDAQAGLILNVSSVLGFLPAPFMGLYAASKHALEGLSETLDHEVRGLGIRVTLVEPSFTRTKLDTDAARAALEIDDYAEAYGRSLRAISKQIENAPDAMAVARKIEAIIRGPYRLRHAADNRAKLLGFLRRFAPAKRLDSGIRSTFGL